VLLKASRGVGLEVVAEALVAADEAGSEPAPTGPSSARADSKAVQSPSDPSSAPTDSEAARG
jgi:hypothetical protein